MKCSVEHFEFLTKDLAVCRDLENLASQVNLGHVKMLSETGFCCEKHQGTLVFSTRLFIYFPF